MTPLLRVVFFVVLAGLAAPVLQEIFPGLDQPSSIWLAAIGLGVAFWFGRKRTPENRVKETPPPRLEELERQQASMLTLQWPSGVSAKPATGNRSARTSTKQRCSSAAVTLTQSTHRSDRSGVSGAAPTIKEAEQKDAGSIPRHQGWLPKGQTVSVRGRDIGGMVYVGRAPMVNGHGYGEKCRAYIDPSLPVAREGNDKAGAGMNYWPGYSSISPECRATYLDWLVDGAKDESYNAGYMFLYFYGLERRFLSMIRTRTKSAS